jgi:hypothetical protein
MKRTVVSGRWTVVSGVVSAAALCVLALKGTENLGGEIGRKKRITESTEEKREHGDGLRWGLVGWSTNGGGGCAYDVTHASASGQPG